MSLGSSPEGSTFSVFYAFKKYCHIILATAKFVKQYSQDCLQIADTGCHFTQRAGFSDNSFNKLLNICYG